MSTLPIIVIVKINTDIQINRNRTGSPEINPEFCGQLIYDKRDRTIIIKKKETVSFPNKWAFKNWTAICNGIKLDHFPYRSIQK